jgi:NAD(P)-dependent dehydrogenase (short-subunit alcohol dehydrogenase family)
MMLQLLLISSALAAPKKHSSDAASRIRRAARNRAVNDVGVDPLPLQGKLAIVTGGGRGIGAAVAKALAQRGCRVLITYRSNVDAAADTMLSLPGDGHDARQCDVTDADAVAQLFEDVDADIVVNNAAIYEESHFLDSTFEDWQRVWRGTLDANLIGPANVIFHAGRSMARRGGGVIVCVSSRGAFRGEPTAPAYGASKAGLNQLSQSAAKALAPSNVVVGVVAPGFVDTAMAAEVLQGPRGDAIRGDSPFNRVASVEEVAEAVLYFTNTDAKWSSGAIIDVNGASYLRS